MRTKPETLAKIKTNAIGAWTPQVALTVNDYVDIAADLDLAGNAYDILMRRPWGVRAVDIVGVPRGFEVFDITTNVFIVPATWPDPFTAIVKTEKWVALLLQGVSPRMGVA